MGSTPAPASALEPNVVPVATGAVWHHESLATVDVDALEALHKLLEASRAASKAGYLGAAAAVHDELGYDRTVLARGLDAALVTVYRELVERGGRVFVSRGSVGVVPPVERCESPICHLAHDAAGRHLPADRS